MIAFINEITVCCQIWFQFYQHNEENVETAEPSQDGFKISKQFFFLLEIERGE